MPMTRLLNKQITGLCFCLVCSFTLMGAAFAAPIYHDGFYVSHEDEQISFFKYQDGKMLIDKSINLGIPVIDLKFNPANGIILVFGRQRDGHKGIIYVLDFQTKDFIIRTPEHEKIVSCFWLDECRFAVLQDNNKHGGTVQVFQLSESIIEAKELKRSKKEISLRDVPAQEAPVCIWQQDFLNTWAYYSNASRRIFNEIGDGRFYGFQISNDGGVYYRESSKPANMYFFSKDMPKPAAVINIAFFELTG